MTFSYFAFILQPPITVGKREDLRPLTRIDKRNYIKCRFCQLFILTMVRDFLSLAYVKCVKKLSIMQKVLAAADMCMYNEEN